MWLIPNSSLKRNIVLFVAVLGVLVGVTLTAVKVTTDYLLYQEATSTARNWARYLAESVTDLEQIAAGEQPSDASMAFFRSARKAGQVFRYEIFNREGFSQLVSDQSKIALVDLSEYSAPAARAAATAQPIVDVKTGNSIDLPSFFARAFVPVVVDLRTIATVSAYVDQTEQRDRFFKAFLLTAAVLCLLTGLSFAIPATAWYRRTMEKQRAEELVRQQKLQLDTALNNMSQGLNLVDERGRLVICNDRYRQMYGLSRDAAKAGSTLRDLVEKRIAAGTFFSIDPEKYVSDVLTSMEKRKPIAVTRPMNDGRVITVIGRPIPGIGWVATHEDVTERHRLLQEREQTEKRLREQTLQLDTALQNMLQGILLFDSTKRVVICNRRYIDMYGLSPDVVKPGLPFDRLIAHRKERGSFSGDVDKYCNDLYAALALGETVGLVVDLPNGRSIHILNQPMAGGGWVATHEDVTERQRLLREQERSEQLLREEKLKLDVALQNMRQGLCMFDAEGRIVLFNNRYAQGMGLPADFLQGLSLLELFKHRKATGDFIGDPEQFYADVLAGMRDGKPTTKIMKTVQGRALRVVDQPMPSGGWVATFEDITEQLQVESDRDRTRRFLELIIDNVPATIFVKQASDRRYVLVNRAGEKFWGISRADMIGKTADDILPPDEAAAIVARDDELLRSGQPIFDEREVRTPTGGIRSISARRVIFQGEDDKSRYMLGVIEDITARKRADAQIAHLAHYDALTDLPNRVLLRERLEQNWPMSGAADSLRCFTSISIISRASTTLWVILPVMSCLRRLPTGCVAVYGIPTRSPVWAVTNLRSCKLLSIGRPMLPCLRNVCAMLSCGRLIGSTVIRSSLMSASASRCRPMMVATWINCSRTPTWPCTGPRRKDAVPADISKPRWMHA